MIDALVDFCPSEDQMENLTLTSRPFSAPRHQNVVEYSEAADSVCARFCSQKDSSYASYSPDDHYYRYGRFYMFENVDW